MKARERDWAITSSIRFFPTLTRYNFMPVSTPCISVITGFVSGDLKLLSDGQSENVSVPLSVFFLKM
jgi:hypothetical protein